MKFIWIVILLRETVSSSGGPYSPDPGVEKKLHDKISPWLPKYGGPYGGYTQVYVDPEIHQVLDVNEREGYWTASISIPIMYQVPNITWDPAQFGYRQVIQVDKDSVWTPVVTVYGAIKLEKSFEFDLVSIDYNGWVLLQASSLVAKITLENNVTLHKTHNYRPNDQWEIVNLEELRVRRSRVRLHVMDYEVHFRRKPFYYLVTIVFPVTVIYLLSGLAFFLPSDDGEKLSFGVTMLLAQIVAVSAMSDIFPASSTSIPLLLYFVSGVTLHMAIMCLESVIVLGLSQKGWRKWMGPRLRKFIASKFVAMIGLKPFTSKLTNNFLAFGAKRQSENNRFDGLPPDPDEDAYRGNSELLQQKRENNHLRWKFLAMVVDRILLIIHMIVVVANLAFFANQILY
ncbi:neuronal acetylcholine receptor subunit beta-3-like isoform X2 [Convolutriloba macropyga]|uniref:neuronal acetylcholine receptor subunit beta-3-like isoform X2 n=1 Tax=Convolutriloba macropyga TaxID=536237 RepID=UPI003F51E0DF